MRIEFIPLHDKSLRVELAASSGNLYIEIVHNAEALVQLQLSDGEVATLLTFCREVLKEGDARLPWPVSNPDAPASGPERSLK